MVESNKVNNEFIAKIFSLTKSQDWLLNLVDEILDLTNECQSIEEQELVFELLQRFTYLRESTYMRDLESCLDKIIDDWKLPENKTLIVAPAMRNKPDSSQRLIYDLKPLLYKRGWTTHKLLNSADRAHRELGPHSYVVFLDEFIGSGQTMKGRINTLRLRAKDHNFEIFVCCIACSVVGKNVLEDLDIPLHYSHLIKKGISDYYRNSLLEDRIQQMERLESILTEEYCEVERQPFGWGQCEALYGRQYGNAPNNVFPIFWWPKRYGEIPNRKTILVRAMSE